MEPDLLANLPFPYAGVFCNFTVALLDLFRTAFSWLASQPFRMFAYLLAFWLVHCRDLLHKTADVSGMISFYHFEQTTGALLPELSPTQAKNILH